MEDQAIVALFFAREERAITETDRKYGGYCRAVAYNILKNKDDTDECVNDTYMQAWNTIPPQRPEVLSVFLGTITRNLSLNRYRAARTQKRGGGQLPVALEELEFCMPDGQSVEGVLKRRRLAG